MKKILFTLLIAASFTFTGCIDILEELFLKKDGTGTYSMTIDMSALMEESTRSMLKSFAQEEGADVPEEADKEVEMDTVIYLKDMPAENRGDISRPEFYDKVSMKVESSTEKELLKMSFILDFDNAEDIDYFLKNLDKMMKSSEDGALPGELGGMDAGGMGGLIPAAGKDYRLFDFGKKVFTRYKSPEPAESLGEGEEMAMMKMFMAGATYKTVYHFPGKVKSASNPDAKVDGKTVTIEGGLIDVIDGKADLSTTVKFKKK